jgi:hypothetical protein
VRLDPVQNLKRVRFAESIPNLIEQFGRFVVSPHFVRDHLAYHLMCRNGKFVFPKRHLG